LRKLPPVLQSFLRALQSRDWQAMPELFAEGGAVIDHGVEYKRQEISAWGHKCLGVDSPSLKLINPGRRGRKPVLIVVVPDGDGGIIGSSVPRFELRFTIAGHGISKIEVSREKVPLLPDSVAAFVDAMNSANLDALVMAFADDALVNDQLQERRGRSEIRKWATHEILGRCLTMRVYNIDYHYQHIILTAHIDGQYDKRGLPDPLTLTFYFSLSVKRIGQLFIIHNYPIEEAEYN